MRAARKAIRAVLSFTVVPSLVCLLPWTARAQEQPPPGNEAPPPAAPPAEAPPPAPAPEPPGAEQKAAEPATGVAVAEFYGWKFSIEGRLNTFFSYGFGNQRRGTDPNDGGTLNPAGGVGLNENQTNASGNFATPRVRNGFLGNVLTFKVTRNLTPTTTLTANLSLWSDIETNLSVYLFPATYMQEGYMKLEGPWGSLTAGRQLALFSRGAVEIDGNYG